MDAVVKKVFAGAQQWARLSQLAMSRWHISRRPWTQRCWVLRQQLSREGSGGNPALARQSAHNHDNMLTRQAKQQRALATGRATRKLTDALTARQSRMAEMAEEMSAWLREAGVVARPPRAAAPPEAAPDNSDDDDLPIGLGGDDY